MNYVFQFLVVQRPEIANGKQYAGAPALLYLQFHSLGCVVSKYLSHLTDK